MDQEASPCAPLGLSEEMKSGPGGSCACGAWVFNSQGSCCAVGSVRRISEVSQLRRVARI